MAPGTPIAVYHTTAGVLARILFRCDVAELSRGYYEGTKIPLRKVDPSARIKFTLYRASGLIEDQDGGWIADKFGPWIGIRDARRCAEQLDSQPLP